MAAEPELGRRNRVPRQMTILIAPEAPVKDIHPRDFLNVSLPRRLGRDLMRPPQELPLGVRRR